MKTIIFMAVVVWFFLGLGKIIEQMEMKKQALIDERYAVMMEAYDKAEKEDLEEMAEYYSGYTKN